MDPVIPIGYSLLPPALGRAGAVWLAGVSPVRKREVSGSRCTVASGRLFPERQRFREPGPIWWSVNGGAIMYHRGGEIDAAVAV